MFKAIRKSFSLTLYVVYLLVLIYLSLNLSGSIFLIGSLPLFLVLNVNVPSLRLLWGDFLKTTSHLLVFFFVYYMLFGYNGDKLGWAMISFIILFLNLFIIYTLIRKKELLNVENTMSAFLVIGFFIVFLPSLLITGSLKFGAFYNLLDPRLLTATTVEGPLLISVLLLLGLYNLMSTRRITSLNITSILFAIFVLLLFNRRGFIFSSFFSIGFYIFYSRTKLHWTIYLLFAFMFLPMFWEVISLNVLAVAKSDLLSGLIVRNNTEDLLTATGRAIGWTNILELFFTFDSKYLLGYYGKQPEELFVTTEQAGRFEHAHNSFLQLFLDSGYVGNIVFIILIAHSFHLFIKARRSTKGRVQNFYFLIIILLIFLSATETVIRHLQFSNFIFVYAVVGFNWINRQIIMRNQNKKYQLANSFRNKGLQVINEESE